MSGWFAAAMMAVVGVLWVREKTRRLTASSTNLAVVGGNHANVSRAENVSGVVVKRYGDRDKDKFDSELRVYVHYSGPEAAVKPFLPRLFPSPEPTTKPPSSFATATSHEPVPSSLTLSLEDVTAPFSAASLSVMDVKLGTRTWRQDVSTKPDSRYTAKLAAFGVHREGVSKRDYMQWRDTVTSSSSLGLRVTGMMCCKGPGRFCTAPQNDAYVEWATSVGVDVSARQSILYFFHDGTAFRTDVMAQVVCHLDRFIAALDASPFFHANEFIGTSVLIVYDAAARHVAVRWIDFANVYSPSGVSGKQDGVLHGLRSLHAVLQQGLAAIQSGAPPVLDVPESSVSSNTA